MKQKIIITIAAAAAIALVWYLFIASPQLQENRKLRSSVDESERQLADLRNVIVKIPEYCNMRQKMLEEKHLLISRLYSKDDLIKLFDEFAGRAHLHDLELVEISPSLQELLELNNVSPDANSPRMLDMTLKFRGTLSNAGRFIEEIEKQSFYKGLNHCRISNPVEKRPLSDISLGFRAVLGTIKDS